METQRASSSFMKRVDNYLLKNFPVTWSSRILTAGILATGFVVLLTVISFVVPNEPRDSSQVEYWITLVSIISLLAFIFWMIFLLRFNVFKRYGKWKSTDSLKTFVFYFIIISIIISWPFVPPIVESVRANAAFTTDELAKDINDMNSKICQLEIDSIDTRFPSDTFEISKIDRGDRMSGSDEDQASLSGDAVPTRVETIYRENYYFIDKSNLDFKIAEADSVEKLSDSVYVIYECPTYKFIYAHSVEGQGGKIMSSMDLYHQVLEYRHPIDKNKVRNQLGALFVKYSPDHNGLTLKHPYGDHSSYGNMNYESRIREKYDLIYINASLDNIAEKKYRWDDEMIEVCWRLFYYITLCLSVLLFIYRHTTRRTFFLSLLAGVVLTILTSLFMALDRSGSSFFVWMIVYFVVFVILSSFIATSRSRTLFSGIGLNMLVFLTPFMPLIITAYYYQLLHHRYRSKNYYNTEDYKNLFENEKYHLFLSEIGGALLLVLLMATLYQRAYRKWFSLPEL